MSPQHPINTDVDHSSSVSLATLLLTIPKRGETSADCQDAGYVLKTTGRFALSDGATESYLAREWAETLCRFACNDQLSNLDSDFGAWLQGAQAEWRQKRDALLRDPEAPWWQQDPTRLAAATLVAIELDKTLRGETFTWRSFAIGDSCGFLIRRGVLVETFPCRSLTDFGLRPACLFSGPVTFPYQPTVVKGEGELGDVFILATDALAEWIHWQFEQGFSPWKSLLAIRTAEDLTKFVDDERSQMRMRNDDVALLVVETSLEPPTITEGLDTPRLALVPNLVEGAPQKEETHAEPLVVLNGIRGDEGGLRVLLVFLSLTYLALVGPFLWATLSRRRTPPIASPVYSAPPIGESRQERFMQKPTVRKREAP